MKFIIKCRVWLLRKLSFGRPIVLNVRVNGMVDFGDADRWGLFADSYVDGSSGKTVLRTLRS